MNRSERRQQARAEFAIQNKLKKLSNRGASVEDLRKAYNDINGEIREKLETLTRAQLMDYSAASLITLLESGNSRESCIDFIKGTIIALRNQIDSGELGEQLLYKYGVYLDFDDALEPVKINPQWKPEVPDEPAVWQRANSRPCSTVFICPKCGRKAYDLSGGNNSKALQGRKRQCSLSFCPHCGREIGKQKDGDHDAKTD